MTAQNFMNVVRFKLKSDCVDKYGNQIEVSKESFENRSNKARAILLTSK